VLPAEATVHTRYANVATELRACGSRGHPKGVNGTPTFFIDGVRYNGSFDLPDLLDALRAAAA
jgi:2-hydroxychromene-2-carboxylate isomerase